ncbi:18075_t:CDS:2 [Funneliformis geosporum]|uniref:7060_t:CDS:1 n=1 Tax=Funneliformis geosporum TaxID=1117311 RepID=A0A9W4SIR3_9GLOM|nr:18075_t:CDS:2 [Funneliformis geosporum]CAI2170908.1 7060_t:CDS:2 [Funneliformis geosporum]
MWPPLKTLPEVKSFIGVIFAVTGNILISVALNLQKNAHNELQRLQLAFINNSNTHSQAASFGSDLSSRSLHTQNDDSYEVLLDPEQYSETNYLRSKAWWTGIILMIIGELGNFMAYAFAPASVVAPLGTVALISNVILAPIMLKERFRKQDLIGILIAIIGAVVVVLDPEAIWNAIKQTPFIIYFIITATLASFLMYLSDRIGHKTCFVDLSLVAIFGGYTVLATKSISSMLTMTYVAMFTYSITYFLLIILMSTAVLQIKFLNKALRQFDSTEVIPTQFVLFTISAIIGSAVLYKDFADMNFWKFAGFLIGCISTFVGVYFITSNRNNSEGYSHQSPNNLSSGTVRSNSIMIDPLRAVLPVLPDELGASNGSVEFNRQYLPFNHQRSVATSIPRRHTLAEPVVFPSTPLLNGSASRQDGLLRQLVHGVSTTSLTAGVSQALNSVGARHSHALGLDQVFENYWLKMISEQNRSSLPDYTQRDYGVHRRSNSVPPGLISRGVDLSNYQNRLSSPLATNVEDDEESFNTQPKSFTNSSYLSTSYNNYEYYDSEYTDSAQTDDDARTISGLTISTNGSNIGIYTGDEGSTYEAFPGIDDFNNHSDDINDLPDLPLRRDYGGATESESEM